MRHNLVCPTLEFLRRITVTSIVLLIVAPSARAADFEWDGGGGADNSWGNSQNWNQPFFPGGSDNIILTAASVDGPITIDVDGDRSISYIFHNGATGNYTFGETVGAETITLFGSDGFTNVLINGATDNSSELIFNSNLVLNQSGSVRRFLSVSGRIVVSGNVGFADSVTGPFSLSLTSSNLLAGPWATVNGVISDGTNATVNLIAGLEEGYQASADGYRGEVSVTGLNTFTGSVRITAATLDFNSIENIGSSDPNSLGMPSSGNETIVMGTSNNLAVANKKATLKYVGSSTASNTSNRPIEIKGNNTIATIDASGAVPLVLSGGIGPDASSSGTRTLNLAGSNTDNNTLSGAIDGVAGNGELSINKSGAGKWILSGNSPNLDGVIQVDAGELVVTGMIGSASLTARYATIQGGALTLDGGSMALQDFDNPGGTFNFKSGTLRITGNNTLGGGAGSFTIGANGSGQLRLEGGSQVFGNVTLQGSDDSLIASAGGTYQFTNLNNSAGGTVTGAAGVHFQIDGGTFTDRVNSGTATFSSGIQGTGGFTKQGFGTLVFDGAAHTYSGDTRIEGGTLRVTAGDLPTVPTYVEVLATLDLQNAVGGDEIGPLSGSGTVLTPISDAFAVNVASGNATFLGHISGSGAFAKRGAGLQFLFGASDYTGQTRIDPNGGTLEIVGSVSGTSDISIGSEGTLYISNGTLDTPGNVKLEAGTSELRMDSGMLKADSIDRTTYVSQFNWTGGTVHLHSAIQIASGATTIDKPFADSLTLTTAMALNVDDTLSVGSGGTLNINGGSVTADTIVTGGTINFSHGTMHLRDDQSLSASRLAALGIVAPLNFQQTLIVDGIADISGKLALAGGTFSAGEINQASNLLLQAGTLNITNSDLQIVLPILPVEVLSGMTVNVTNGGLNNAGDFNVIGGTANFATASTNQAGAEINAINATLTFTGGLTNNGDVNLINSTVNGSLVNGAGSSSSLLGSNSFSDNLVLASGDTLLIDIGGDQPGEFDIITVGDEATLAGQLAVSLSAGFTPTAGQQITVLTAGSVTNNGLVLSGSAASSFNLLVSSTSVILQAIAAALPGDYNQNGTVDAADYTVWRDHLGDANALPNDDSPGVGPDDYSRWKTNFGNSTGGGSGSSANAAVPEPATLVLLIFAAASVCTRRCRASEKRQPLVTA
jgi:autotransporter-associated beta strand protein